MDTSSTYPGILHRYSPHLVAFEYAPHTQASNTVIFLGGLFDGFLTVPYVEFVVKALPDSYTLVQPILSSSYLGWGTSSLGQDVTEIAQCVEHFRSLRTNGKVVLLGHSTGCQDVMHYLISEGQRPKIDGGILQAGISDREALCMSLAPEEYERNNSIAQEYVRDARAEDVLPRSVTGALSPAPVTARRWLSLASAGPAHDGEDDYFSSDFGDERLRKTFGKAGATGVPLSILLSGSDQYMPETVNKKALLRRWVTHIEEGGGGVDKDSGIVEGASHNLKEGGRVVEGFVKRVVAFLERVEKGTVGGIRT